ncbi:hypothetical protein C2845_PM05G06790 [Panicum miliaceum]|uniref:Gnk2-homologous domain-containing protein n=1 Tax=Panicum miliaceum TaxID=4540 RepID=A0A3L6SYI3_PANMI|nr:hypothetical protein C2845_PM05G06790 [Panicum miliaceum]
MFVALEQRVICSVKATIERHKKAHAVGSSSGAPLLELNAQMKMLKLLLIIAAVLQFALVATSSSSAYWVFYCAGGNFTPGNPYGSTLDAMAAVLPRRASSSPLLFTSSQQLAARYRGKTTTVYVIAQCRRDSRRSSYESCIKGAFEDTHRLRGSRVGAFVYRKLCTVSYYDEKISLFPNTATYHAVASSWDHANISIRGKIFDDAVHELAQAVVDRTITSSQLFSTGQKAVDAVDYQLNI